MEEIVRITESNGSIHIYNGGFKKFTEEGYRLFIRPFRAEFCTLNTVTVTDYTDRKEGSSETAKN